MFLHESTKKQKQTKKVEVVKYSCDSYSSLPAVLVLARVRVWFLTTTEDDEPSVDSEEDRKQEVRSAPVISDTSVVSSLVAWSDSGKSTWLLPPGKHLVINSRIILEIWDQYSIQARKTSMTVTDKTLSLLQNLMGAMVAAFSNPLSCFRVNTT